MEDIFNISIPLDSNEMIGRECLECEGYFKIKLGIGLDTSYCHCPYCNYEGESDIFWTKAQNEYIASTVEFQLDKYLNKMFRDIQRKNRSDLIKFEFKGGRLPIKYYEEEELETFVLCDNCRLEFSIYVVFTNCPDCDEINAFFVYRESLEVTLKKLNIFLKPEIPLEIRDSSLKHILADCISTFDALGKFRNKKIPQFI